MKKKIVLIILVFLLIPYFIDLIIIGNETIKINVKNSDFFLFLGSYLGAGVTILGTLWINRIERDLKEKKESNEKSEKTKKLHLLFFNTIYLEYSNLERIIKSLYDIPSFISGTRRADTVFLRKIILELNEDFIDLANKIIFDIEKEYNNKEILENNLRNDKVAISKRYQSISALVRKMEEFDKNDKVEKTTDSYWNYYGKIFKEYEEE